MPCLFVLVFPPRPRVLGGLLRLFAAECHQIRIDDRKHIEDVRKYDICLSGSRPRAHFWIELIGKGAVRRDVLNKGAERSPRQRAPDIVQRVAVSD